MSSWDDVLNQAKASEGGIFVSLKNDKDKAVVVLCGDPHMFETTFQGSSKPSKRIAMNAAVLVGGKYEMKVLETSMRTFQSVASCRKKYGPDMALEITRHGAPKSTDTRYEVLPETKLTADLMSDIGKLALHDLALVCDRGKGKTDDNIPF